jgi:hypothetical protein
LRARCKDCGGSQICEHGKIKYQCKECIAKRKADRENAPSAPASKRKPDPDGGAPERT